MCANAAVDRCSRMYFPNTTTVYRKSLIFFGKWFLIYCCPYTPLIKHTHRMCHRSISLQLDLHEHNTNRHQREPFSFSIFVFLSSGSKITRYINIVLYALIVTQNCIHSFVARATFNLVRIIDNDLQ